MKITEYSAVLFPVFDSPGTGSTFTCTVVRIPNDGAMEVVHARLEGHGEIDQVVLARPEEDDLRLPDAP